MINRLARLSVSSHLEVVAIQVHLLYSLFRQVRCLGTNIRITLLIRYQWQSRQSLLSLAMVFAAIHQADIRSITRCHLSIHGTINVFVMRSFFTCDRLRKAHFSENKQINEYLSNYLAQATPDYAHIQNVRTERQHCTDWTPIAIILT